MKKYLKKRLQLYLSAFIIGVTLLSNYSIYCFKVNQTFKKGMSWAGATTLTSVLASSFGYTCHIISKPLSKKIVENQWLKDNMSYALPFVDAYSSKALGIGALLFAGLKGGRVTTQGFYMLLAGERILPSAIGKALAKLDLYLMNLAIVLALEDEFTLLVDNLNSEKYYSAHLEDRLKLLDAVFYYVKEGNIIPRLERGRNIHRGAIKSELNKLERYIEKETNNEQIFKQLLNNYKALIKKAKPHERDEILAIVQVHRESTLYNDLSELFTHLKLFNKGFKEGINIIDEARSLNRLTQKVFDHICYELKYYHKEVQNTVKECARIAYIENIIKTYNIRKLTPS